MTKRGLPALLLPLHSLPLYRPFSGNREGGIISAAERDKVSLRAGVPTSAGGHLKRGKHFTGKERKRGGGGGEKKNQQAGPRAAGSAVSGRVVSLESLSCN